MDFNNRNTLVLSGGGIKGLYYIGVLRLFEESNIIKNIKTFAGSSIGSLFCLLMLIGYSSQELEELFCLLNLSQLKQINSSNFFSYFGLDSGNKIYWFLEKILYGKHFNKNITLKELFDITQKKLIISGVCVDDKECYYFSHETHPDMNVRIAIRISMSMPFYFVPVLYNDKLWIDGGIMDNYPMQLFNDMLEKTVGIYIQSEKKKYDIKNIEDYLISIYDCFNKGYYIKSSVNYKNNTVIINPDKINNIIQTNIPNDMIKEIINDGYMQTKKYL